MTRYDSLWFAGLLGVIVTFPLNAFGVISDSATVTILGFVCAALCLGGGRG